SIRSARGGRDRAAGLRSRRRPAPRRSTARGRGPGSRPARAAPRAAPRDRGRGGGGRRCARPRPRALPPRAGRARRGARRRPPGPRTPRGWPGWPGRSAGTAAASVLVLGAREDVAGAAHGEDAAGPPRVVLDGRADPRDVDVDAPVEGLERVAPHAF